VSGATNGQSSRPEKARVGIGFLGQVVSHLPTNYDVERSSIS